MVFGTDLNFLNKQLSAFRFSWFDDDVGEDDDDGNVSILLRSSTSATICIY